MLVKLLALTIVLLPSGPAPVLNERPPQILDLFEQYGKIDWADERARLDNFAIQLMNDERLIGYIIVFDAKGGCPGEAQARAIRAKKYLMEVRAVPWNRVIWRRDGYLDGVSTILQPVVRNVNLPYPLLSATKEGPDGPESKACRVKVGRIRTWRPK